MTFFRGIVLVAFALTAQERQPVFSVKVDAVQVDVQVTRRGRPVSGLRAQDFEVRDNGVLQQIESVTVEDVPLDVFLVLDSSGSVEGERLGALKAAAVAAVKALAPRDQIALLTFSHRLAGPARLSREKATALAAIDRMTASGATSILDAIYAALVLPHASLHRALIIVFTDGHDTASWLPATAVLDLAKETDAVVYGVTLEAAEPEPASISISFPWLRSDGPFPRIHPTGRATRPEDGEFLQELAELTGGRVFDTRDPRGLRKLFTQAVAEMKTRYVLSYTPEGVERQGWHALSVKLTKHDADVTARRGYFVPTERK